MSKQGGTKDSSERESSTKHETDSPPSDRRAESNGPEANSTSKANAFREPLSASAPPKPGASVSPTESSPPKAQHGASVPPTESSPPKARLSVPLPGEIMPAEMETKTPPPLNTARRRTKRPTNPTQSLVSASPEQLASPISLRAKGVGAGAVTDSETPTFAVSSSGSDERTEPNAAFAAVRLRPAHDQGFGLKPGTMWDDEKLSSEHLSDNDEVDAWAERAEWFESEAQRAKDPAQRARLLLVASEHWAMIGNLPQARQTAEDANRHDSGFGLRQARNIAGAEGDYEAVKGVLTGEAHSSGTPAARAHAAFFNAEVERHLLGQPANAQRHLDQAASTEIGDPRGALQRFITKLQNAGSSPHVRWPTSEENKPLAEAATLLGHLRNEHVVVQVQHSADQPVLAFVGARNALIGRDRMGAAEHLTHLAGAEGFERSARWLAQALWAPEPQGRRRSLAELRTLAAGGLTPTLQRSIAARALELGDEETTELSLASNPQSPQAAFSLTDKIAVSALSGRQDPDLEDLLEQSLRSEATRPMALGVSAALSLGSVMRRATSRAHDPDEVGAATASARSDTTELPDQPDPNASQVAAKPSPGNQPTLTASPEVLALQQLAHYLSLEPHPRWRTNVDSTDDYDEALLARLREVLGFDLAQDDLAQQTEHDPKQLFSRSPLAALFELELAQARGDTEHLVKHLLAWPDDGSAQVGAPSHYVAGILFEAAGKTDAAIQHYSQALSEELVAEPSVRALAGLLPPGRFEKLLQSLANQVEDGERRALLLTEAAMAVGERPGGHAEEIVTLLKAADAECGDLAPTQFLYSHRDAGSSSATLNGTQNGANGSYSQALDLCRKALEAKEAAGAAKLWREALALYPNDIALLDQAVRFNAISAQERAQYEADAATQVSDRLSAKRLTRSSESQLPPLPSVDGAEVVEPRASVTQDAARAPVEAAPDLERSPASLLELARAKRLAGDTVGEYELLRLLREKTPQSLEVLQRLEFLSLRGDDAERLVNDLFELAHALPRPDASGHALMAARIAKQVKGWSAALPYLKLAYQGDKASLRTLRELEAQTRTTDDHALRQEVCELIARQTGHPLDKASLLLRAAHAASARDELSHAKALASDAARVAPGDLVVQSQAAQLIELGKDPAAAAAAYERLAHLSNLTEHKVDALQAAARLGVEGGTDPTRATANLERAVSLLPTRATLYEPLVELYESTGQLNKLTALLDTQLSHATDAKTRSQIQVKRGHVLAQLGQTTAAKAALSEVLRVHPDSPDALKTLAALAHEDGDPSASEQALLQLVRLSPDQEVQADGYLRLARLYAGELDNLERAERCFSEVLRRRAQDLDTLQELLPLYERLGRPGRAVDLIEERLATSSAEATQRRLQLMLVTTYESILQDGNAAEATLIQVLSAWPLHSDVVSVAADYYQRAGQDSQLEALQQAQTQALNERFGDDDFGAEGVQAVGVLAERLSDPVRAEVAFSLANALRGKHKRFKGIQEHAISDALNGALAPSLLNQSLRTLLARSGGALELAYPLDLSLLGAKKMPEHLAGWQQQVNEWAEGLAMIPPKLLVSDSHAPILACAGGQTPCIVLSGALIAAEEPALLECALFYSLKLIKTNLAVLARLQPDQGLALMQAFVGCMLHGEPTSEHDDVRTAQERMLSFIKGDRHSQLAKEVMDQLPACGTKLGQAARAWAMRAAIAATGAPDAALRLQSAVQNAPTPPQFLPECVSSELVREHPALQELIRACLSEAFITALRLPSLSGNRR